MAGPYYSSTATRKYYLSLFLLIGSVDAFLFPNPIRRRRQKWGIHCPKVHSSTISPLSTEDFLDAYSEEFLKLNDDLAAEIPSLASSAKNFDDNYPVPPEPSSSTTTSLVELCKLMNATPIDLLRLQMTSDGVRGVFLNSPVKEDDVVLSIPLESCLTDDKSPSWLQIEDEEDRYDESGGSDDKPSSAWATRLAASLVDLYLQIRTNPELTKQHAEWVALLPDKEYLKASLPVHWPDDTVLNAKSTALELAVDSAFFTRAEAMEDLLVSLRAAASEITTTTSEEELRDMCSSALDVVQTRSCRLDAAATTTTTTNTNTGSPIRVLAPIFDFINHGSVHSSRKESAANVQFGMEGNNLVVRALSDIKKDEEVLVDYGKPARPAWKCLISYGFVPDFKADFSDVDYEGDSEENVAEIFIDGIRYEIGPSFIPFEIVERMAAKLHVGSRLEELDDPELALTPEIAEKISERITQVAYQLLLEPETDFFDDHPAASPTPFQVISSRLASSLRWHQYRVLVACSKGLKQYYDGEDTLEST